ncbi:MAG: FAD-dependent oxidoreductase [Methylophilaceae bacterium]
MTKNPNYCIEALIVGAGPTGLTLGICLLRQGKSVLIVEKHETSLNFSRAILVNSDTLEALEPYGVSDKLRLAGIPVNGFSIYANNQLVSQAQFDLSDIDHFHPLCLPQLKTEECLLETFLQTGGQIIRGYEFDASNKKDIDNQYTITLRSNLESKDNIIVNYLWLFGCDGYHSAVRENLDIPFTGNHIVEKGYAVDAHLDYWPYKTNVNVWFSANGAGLAIQIAVNTVRIIATTKAICQKLMSQLPIKVISWEADFDIHFKVTNSYGRNHVWLAGDAVHVHSPLGGRGMNMGIADAIALAKYFNQNNLKNYQLIRMPIAHEWVKNNYRISKIVMKQGLIYSFFRLCISILLSILGKLGGNKFAAFVFGKISTAKVKLAEGA